MKQLMIAILLMATMPLLTKAQAAKNFDTTARITPYRVQINDLKTTVILFPAAIKSVDRGSRYVLAEKVKDADNVLKLKAERLGFPESNLSVITADGRLYSFIVDAAQSLPYQAIDLRKQEDHEKAEVKFAGTGLNDQQVRELSARIGGMPAFLKSRDKENGMRLQLAGIYMVQDVMFYELRVDNLSHIDYTIDFTRFFVRDRKKIKREAVQEQEIIPLTQCPDTNLTIGGKRSKTLVLAFKKFTIADNKNLSIEMSERGGDRHLSVSLDGRQILKARPVTQ